MTKAEPLKGVFVVDNQQNNQQSKNNQKQEQDINQLLKIKREKLAMLQEAGKDPDGTQQRD